MIGSIVRASILAFATAAASGSSAVAQTAYDGRWSIFIVTTRGACETYNFPAEIINGTVTFPGIVHANGRVSGRGAVRVFVSAGGRSASGSGRLSAYSGSGGWAGGSSEGRCSGYWTAQRG